MAENELCSANSAIPWAHVYRLGKQADLAASALHTFQAPGYTYPIVEEPGMPFAVAACPAGQFYQDFGLDYFDTDSPPASGPVVQTRQMTDSDGAAYELPSTGNLDIAKDLSFINDADSCLCATLYGVEGGTPTLKTHAAATGNISCCQTDTVPEVGDTLNDTQTFIPVAHGHAGIWPSSGTASGQAPWGLLSNLVLKVPGVDQTDTIFRDAPKCVGTDDGIVYQYAWVKQAGGGQVYRMTHVRRAMSGRFTWRIRAKHMDAIFSRLLDIADPANNGGAYAGKLIDIYGNYIQPGCPASWAILQATGLGLWGWECGPGSIAGNEGASTCTPGSTCLPWKSLCAEAKNCTDSGALGGTPNPKVYCLTINQLNDVLYRLTNARLLFPFDLAAPAAGCCVGCGFMLTDGSMSTGSYSFANATDPSVFPYSVSLSPVALYDNFGQPTKLPAGCPDNLLAKTTLIVSLSWVVNSSDGSPPAGSWHVTVAGTSFVTGATGPLGGTGEVAMPAPGPFILKVAPINPQPGDDALALIISCSYHAAS